MVVDIATVAEGIMGAEGGGEGAGGAQNTAPGVVGVGDYIGAGGVADFDHIALQVRYIVVPNAVVDHRDGAAGGIVQEVQVIASHTHVA